MRYFHDIVRVTILLFIVGMILAYRDTANEVVFDALLLSMFIAGGSHLTRRLLFPALDLQEIAIQAVKNGSIAAAMVFFSVCLVLITLMVMSMSVLR